MKTYTVVHVVEGEIPSTLYQVTRDQLTDRSWVCKNIFHWKGDNEHDLFTAKESIVDPILYNPNLTMLIFEGDAGYIFIFETGLTNLYETTIL